MSLADALTLPSNSYSVDESYQFKNENEELKPNGQSPAKEETLSGDEDQPMDDLFGDDDVEVVPKADKCVLWSKLHDHAPDAYVKDESPQWRDRRC